MVRLRSHRCYPGSFESEEGEPGMVGLEPEYLDLASSMPFSSSLSDGPNGLASSSDDESSSTEIRRSSSIQSDSRKRSDSWP